MADKKERSISAELELLGNVNAAIDTAAESYLEDRKRGFASDKEAWAELMATCGRAEDEGKKTAKLLKELWDAAKDRNDDAFRALVMEMQRASRLTAQSWATVGAMAKIAVEHTED